MTKQPWEYRTSMTGYPWVELCRQDLRPLWAELPPVQRTPRADLVRQYTANGRTLKPNETVNGLFNPLTRQIQIASDLVGWRYADTEHWELCRAVLLRATGDYRIADYDVP